MASIKCGHCGQTHGSASEVRWCYSRETIVNGIRRDAVLAEPVNHDDYLDLPPNEYRLHNADAFAGYTETNASAINAVPAGTYTPEPVEITEGFWQLDGSFYKVQRSQSSSHLYAKVLDVGPGDEGVSTASWTYVPGAINMLRTEGATPLAERDAAAFGRLYGVCMICGRTLTNEESIERGIGPVCAGKQGW